MTNTKLSKAQVELLEQLKQHGEMIWDFNGNSTTQFNLNTAEALKKKGLVNLQGIFELNKTQYIMTLAQ